MAKFRKTDLAGKRFSVGEADTPEMLEALLNSYNDKWEVVSVHTTTGKFIAVMKKYVTNP